jgi:hypothetical protein
MIQNKNARMPIVSLLFMLIFDDAGLLGIARVVPPWSVENLAHTDQRAF